MAGMPKPPLINQKFEHYYALLAHRDQLDDDQRTQLRHLRAELQSHRVLGYTRRDQLLYEILDEFLADERKAVNARELSVLKQETKDRMKAMWRRTGLDRLVPR